MWLGNVGALDLEIGLTGPRSKIKRGVRALFEHWLIRPVTVVSGYRCYMEHRLQDLGTQLKLGTPEPL